MSSEVCGSVIVPFLGSLLPVPLFARRGPLGWFPRFTARTAALRLLVASRPLSSPPRCRVPALAGDGEISQVPQATLAHVPCRKPPVGTFARGSGPAALRWRNRRRPSAHPTARRLPQLRPFRSTSTARVPAVYASQPRSPSHHARLAFRQPASCHRS